MALVSSAVPVIVRSAVPEVIKSLPPVVVKHVAEGPNPWLTFLGPVFLAASGLCVAVWTLLKVYQQIRIASQQLVIANDELSAVKDDFALAQRQFELAQRQFSLAMRIPDVVVDVMLANEVRQVVPGPDGVVYREVSLRILVRNQGTKVAKTLVGELLMPKDVLFTHPRFVQGAGPAVDVQGISYDVWELLPGTLGRRLYPNKSIETGRAYNLRPDASVVKVLWRVDDDEYSYPERGYGEATLEFKLPI
jgi:hypothetical protein